MSRPSDRAIAQAFLAALDMAEKYPSESDDVSLRAIIQDARDIDAAAPEGVQAGMPRGVQEALQRMIEDTFSRGPASVDDGRLVQKWAELIHKSEDAQAEARPFGWLYDELRLGDDDALEFTTSERTAERARERGHTVRAVYTATPSLGYEQAKRLQALINMQAQAEREYVRSKLKFTSTGRRGAWKQRLNNARAAVEKFIQELRNHD